MNLSFVSRLAAAVVVVCASPGFLQAEEFYLRTSYENSWYSPGPPIAALTNYVGTTPGTAAFGGNAFGNTSNGIPHNAKFGLMYSSFGQPVAGTRADVALGDVIEAPAGTDLTKAPANFRSVSWEGIPGVYYECTDPDGAAFYLPQTHQVIAAQPNNLIVEWITTTGTTNSRIYTIDAVPAKRPARIFWTESPYDSPGVDLSGTFPVLHYNSQVCAQTFVTNADKSVTTNGVWLDDNKQLHAVGVTGLFVIQYYKEGTYTDPVTNGVEVVQVLVPRVQLISADVGSRLMPVDTYWANLDKVNGVIPNVTHGLNETVYVHGQAGPKQNWAFSIKRTPMEPWAAEIYWQQRGVLGVLWPYELDWFFCNWPASPQLLVLGDSPNDQARVLIPFELTAEPQADMDPPGHATISERSLRTTAPGYSLIKYTTGSDIWFEVVMTASRTNFLYFDMEPQEWPIGEELLPGPQRALALGFDGTDHVHIPQSFLNNQTNWTLSLWFKSGDSRRSMLYSEGGPGGATLSIQQDSTNLSVATFNKAYGTSVGRTWANAPLKVGKWHYLVIVYSGGTDSGGNLQVYLDDATWTTNGLPRVNFNGDGDAILGGYYLPGGSVSSHFYGKVDNLRIWNSALTADQIRRSQAKPAPDTTDTLTVDFELDDGPGIVVHNSAGDKDGTIYGPTYWCFGKVFPDQQPAEFPGYIHVAQGDRYNVNRYAYPTQPDQVRNSSIFAVNPGELEVWWANRSRQVGMPAVYYPSRVVRYTNSWPDNPPQIVIASEKGNTSDAFRPANEALYFDGTVNSCAIASNNPVLNVGSELTMEAWVKLSNPNGNNKVISWMNSIAGSYSGYVLGVYANAIDVEFWTGTGVGHSLYGDTRYGVIPTNTWTHIAYTFKANSPNPIVTYVNGQPKFTSTTQINEGIRTSTSGLYIGRASWIAAMNTKGSIGEVRIWNKARSAQEIAATWRTRLLGNEPGLVVYYPFQQVTDPSTLADTGQYGVHGAVLNGSWTSPGRPVIATGPTLSGEPSIYYQNDPNLPGYNPNEEHALILDGTVYALRNDLNSTNSSLPYTLVDYVDEASGRPKMLVFGVVVTNEFYNFNHSLQAGLPIEPPMPLGVMPLCAKTDSDNKPPAWRDRKLGWWARSAGDDGGTTNAVMRFYYQVQPSFCFPALAAQQQPAVGSEVPWLPDPAYDDARTSGIPVAVSYTLSWPDNLPKLHLGQTLTKAEGGLPEIWGQLSAEIIYQQSLSQTTNESGVLFDPVVERGFDFSPDIINQMISSRVARRDATTPYVRFPGLPPSLYPRLFYDPNRGDPSRAQKGQLVLAGQRIEPVTGRAYLLLNVLEDFEKTEASAIAAGCAFETNWAGIIASLPGPDELCLIGPNSAYVHAALGAHLSQGCGYVTLAFNNSDDPRQVPPSLPVSLEILQVDTNLYTGDLEVIQPGDPLAEQLSLRYSADFAGHASDCDFRWKWALPLGGLIPNEQFDGGSEWFAYGGDPSPGTNEVLIAGASSFTISDHYFAVQYRPHDTNGPSGSNWSDWTYNLAPGWVKRVMNRVNPFMQMLPDMTANPVDTRATMISQAGGPYQGDVALNMDSVGQAGLISVYETIFNRAMDFSLRANLSDTSLNETLLFAASRLRDLYTLLGDEAYADALDPTIPFPAELSKDTYGGDATSIFPFMNQVPNLLEEELALLRGRDDTLSPSPASCPPVYNRLIWNFTAGINAGEPAYAYNYNIHGNPSNTVGTITEADAKRMYPQGHGDAWGHYLSAIYHYYDLLAYTNFFWQTEPSATLIGSSTTVSTDFFDEQKFAETAAARARTGVEIVKDVFREQYSEDPGKALLAYTDRNTDRAWGMGEWASRAGQAAFYDWAVANSLMLDSLTNLSQIYTQTNELSGPEGIQKIDRNSTPELAEITASLRDIQTQIDSANGGLNPLGLARNVVPFDIDPTAIDAGKTHFEQISERALQAVYNACIVFEQARGATLALNRQFDSVAALDEALTQNETDYHNRLIELYGYPYSDDIGPTGTYPQGYDGPDLINWRILDLENLLANAPTNTQVLEVAVTNLAFFPGSNFEGHEYQDYTNLSATSSNTLTRVGTVRIYVADNGIQIKPRDWGGRRRAQGELQFALSDFVQSWYSLDAKMKAYEETLSALEVELEHRQAEYVRYPSEWAAHEANVERQKTTASIIEGLKISKDMAELLAESLKEVPGATAETIPDAVTGFSGLFPTFLTLLKPEKLVKAGLAAAYYGSMIAAQSLEAGIDAREAAQERWDADLEGKLRGDEYQALLQWNTEETLAKLNEQYVKQAELYAQIEALSASAERVGKLVAEGDRLVAERAQVRSRAAQRIQMARYSDLTFRIFRNDALRRYQQAFALAARYTYLAAKAYDYETGLLRSDTTQTPGSKFLEDVVRARAPGRFYQWLGTPMVGGGVGEPGLADVLARMKADWDVVKGRFGFNNPQTETSRFSLRTELFRIAPSPDTEGDSKWVTRLESFKVANLHELPEFIRYCRPYIDTTNIEPALVIPFSSYVIAGENYFGKALAGGDNAYNASHAATKVRSMGVWFTGYNNTNNSTTSGLANEPQVYLIPVGEDIMRSPTRNALQLRHWQVLDQAIPLPYNVGGADIDNPDWLPVVDSLREPLAQIRRFASFRAYHDSGDFDASETCTNGRLIGRSVWNTHWLLIIPGRTLLSDPAQGVERFVHDVKDIKIFFQTYSIPGD